MAKNTCLSLISQTWLLLVNTIFLGTAGIAIFIGATMYQQSSSLSETTDTRTIAIGILVYGSIVAITALSGCVGSVCKVGSILVFFMGAVSLELVILLAAGIYGIIGLENRKKANAALSLQDWNSRNSTVNDAVQQLFECCGYNPGDSSAYTGPSVSLTGASIQNPCATNTIRPGCHDQVGLVLNYYEKIMILVVVIGAVVSVISLWAANHSLRRKRIIAKGFVAAGAGKSSKDTLLA